MTTVQFLPLTFRPGKGHEHQTLLYNLSLHLSHCDVNSVNCFSSGPADTKQHISLRERINENPCFPTITRLRINPLYLIQTLLKITQASCSKYWSVIYIYICIFLVFHTCVSRPVNLVYMSQWWVKSDIIHPHRLTNEKMMNQPKGKNNQIKKSLLHVVVLTKMNR